MESILIIDDCAHSRAALSNLLIDANYYVADVPCPQSAFEILRDEQFQLIISDLHLPFKMGEHNSGFEYSLNVGIQTIKELIRVFQWIPVFGMSGMAPEEIELAKQQLPGVPIFSKPIRPQVLLPLLKQSLAHTPCRVEQ